ncbi:MAG: imidazole glycerol phosphate synthase subunit HisH [bacterium]|nr:imidazole glycerol phosphate synthase subunit HisH [bacterium]MDE0286950.1 imidazole glycerol phosphate synthase subunit HisH [bacterium]MDE0439217.1 imidazole glycerol phosphate synthase subunit HisH [bacterium]
MNAAPLVAVIDHGAGNLVSIARGLERAGGRVRLVTGPEGLTGVHAVVLPGVGVPGAAMSRLGEAGLLGPLGAWEGPLLGICVGLQLFFDSSDEDGEPCLGFDRGVVRRLVGAPLLPHIGWNDIEMPGGGGTRDRLFDRIEPGATFYFVHSYAPAPEDPSIVIAYARYPRPFAAAVRNGLRVGTQFHPERSGKAGLQVLTNFVAEVREVAGSRDRAGALA